MDLPPASASRLDVFDARLRRTLAEHVSRNEAADVSAARLCLCKQVQASEVLWQRH
jgi:hypothetical protein